MMAIDTIEAPGHTITMIPMMNTSTPPTMSAQSCFLRATFD